MKQYGLDVVTAIGSLIVCILLLFNVLYYLKTKSITIFAGWGSPYKTYGNIALAMAIIYGVIGIYAFILSIQSVLKIVSP